MKGPIRAPPEEYRTMKRLVLAAAAVVLLAAAVSAQKAARPAAGDAGIAVDRLDRMEPAITRLLKDGKFAGIGVTVARDGRVAYQREFGYADFDTKAPLRTDTIYRIFSMTKPITGVAVMMLLEEGRFRLDDPVSKFIPCFQTMQVFDSEGADGIRTVKADREVTVRDLLRHTSGLTYGNPSTAVGRSYQAARVMDPTRTLAETAEAVCKVPLVAQPGTKWEYGISMDILGRIVEIVSGMPLDAFFQTRIFEPLKMVDTGFSVPDTALPRLASLYNFTPGKGLSAVPPASAVDRYRADRVKLPSGGGGLVSTTADYLRFATMLLRGGELDGARLLSPRTVALMTMNQLPAGVEPASWGGKNGGNGYGFTMSVTTDVAKTTGYGSAGDFGWDGAASTFFRVDPKERLVVLVMTQRMPCDLEVQVLTKAVAYQALTDK
jgi:CubicO group peptidase (beta-lactamase class C family)